MTKEDALELGYSVMSGYTAKGRIVAAASWIQEDGCPRFHHEGGKTEEEALTKLYKWIKEQK